MGRHTLEGNPPVDVTLRRSARAKRLSLRVSRLDGRVTLTLPPRTADREGVAFLKERESWLRHHLSKLSPMREVDVDQTIPFEGRDMPIRVRATGRAEITSDHIMVRHVGKAGPQVKALLRTSARTALAAASDHYAAKLGLQYTRLTIRDTRSRWGSCSSAGALMYSWRLIMAPPEVLRYVAAHEVAHLAEMNHSPAFWRVVERLFSDYKPCRAWLREHGDMLHRLNFGD